MKIFRAGLAVALLASVGLTVLEGATPAHANTIVTGHAVGTNFNVSHNGGTLNFWAGAYQTDKGLAFCLQPTKVTSVGQPVGDPVEMTGFTNDQGAALTTTQLNQLAYLTWKVSLNPSPSATDAVVYKLVSTTLLGYNSVPIIGTNVGHDLSLDDPGSDAYNMAAAAGVLDAAQALLAETRAKANNWDGTGAWALTSTPSKPGDALTATVQLPGLGDGFPVVFSVTKPDGQTDVIEVVTRGDTADLSYAAASFGHYQVSAQLGEPAAPRYPLIAAAMGQSQSMLMIGAQPRTWASDVAAFDVTRPTPTIGTTVSSVYTLPGETISDTAKLAQLVVDDATAYRVTGGLFGVPPLAGDACPPADDPAWATADAVLKIDATPVPPEAIGGDGTATLKLGDWQVPLDQPPVCLSYGETLTMTVDGNLAATVDHPVGDGAQTTLVLPVPAISTQISSGELSAGDTVSDTVTVAQLSAVKDVTYTFTGKLVSVPAGPDTTCPDAEDEAWQSAETVTDFAGQIVTTAESGTQIDLPEQGDWQVPAMAGPTCVSYAETVTMTLPGHDPVVVEHAVGQPEQTAIYMPFQAITGGVGTLDLAKFAYLLCGLGGAAAGTWLVRRIVRRA